MTNIVSNFSCISINQSEIYAICTTEACRTRPMTLTEGFHRTVLRSASKKAKVQTELQG